MRKQIISELENRGYNVEPVDVVKNGVTLKGIRFDNGTNVQPTIYVDHYEDMELDEAVDAIVKAVEKSNLNQPQIDASLLTTKDFVLKGVHVGFQRPSEENVVRRPSDFGDIEEYLYVVGGNDGEEQWSYRLTPEVLTASGITEDEAWHKAYENMAQETVIKSIFETMCEMMGGEVPPIPEEGPQMFVLTNKCKVKGAASWVDKESLKALADRMGTKKFFVLPSSIHEMLILPYNENTDIRELNNMVHSINSTQVDPLDQLSDHAYCVEI